jgi:ABC-type phosphonate transport system ATPase subunit
MPAEGVPLLQMRGITKSFFGVPVLDAVDLDVMAGEVHAVVGANGANDADPVALNQYVETASSSSCPVTARCRFSTGGDQVISQTFRILGNRPD